MQLEQAAVARLRGALGHKPGDGLKVLPSYKSYQPSRPNPQTQALIDSVRQSNPIYLGSEGKILSPREIAVINRRYPSGDKVGQSFEEIGKELKLSTTLVHKLEQTAVARLRGVANYKPETGEKVLPAYEGTRYSYMQTAGLVDQVRKSQPDILKPKSDILSPLERKIINRRYPSRSNQGQTLENIGQDLKLNLNQVLEVEKRAVAKLREALSYELKDAHKFLHHYEGATRYSFRQTADLINQVRNSQPSLLKPSSGTLTPIERKIITARYPSGNRSAKTLEEVSKELNISITAVNKLEKGAVSKLDKAFGGQTAIPSKEGTRYSYMETAQFMDKVRNRNRIY